MEGKLAISFMSVAMPLLTAWFWYDKRGRDGRISDLEKKVSANELAQSALITELSVLKTEAKHARELVQVQLAQVNITLDEIKILIKESRNG